MNVHLEKGWQEYIEQQIEAGRFETASDVVRDALKRQMDYFAKRDALLHDLQQGMASIQAGRVNTVTARDIIRMAEERKASS